ncbi:hypothetical protein BESB_067270 [Besnoitia besnoiti]|uniref:SWIRM domain-containing protein n=1 Tax=Besnoitia besnoiti TaxID=94643 RepID=A0A2A9MBU2_BESBE|nr:hypothetical protein BESB_067270 [Besnoitia besnoiti]PFH34694.1 hypothetical protein BESB_067270 [Besnoitia besnoiti]
MSGDTSGGGALFQTPPQSVFSQDALLSAGATAPGSSLSRTSSERGEGEAVPPAVPHDGLSDKKRSLPPTPSASGSPPPESDGSENAKRMRLDGLQLSAPTDDLHAQGVPEDAFPLPAQALRPLAPPSFSDHSRVSAASGHGVVHSPPDASAFALPSALPEGISAPHGEFARGGEDDEGDKADGASRASPGAAGTAGAQTLNGAPGANLARKGENKPVEIAPNVTRLPPYDKNVTSSILVSTATFETISLPSESFRQQLENGISAASAHAGGKTGEAATKREESEGSATTEEKEKSSPEKELANLPLGTPADRPPVPLDEEALRKREEEAWRLAQEKEGREPYKLPTCSSWFDETKIGAVERDLLPTLFAGTSLTGPERDERYLQLRQGIVNLYRADPTKYLSFSDCRKVVAADGALLLRTHSFLDYWGIINFQADPATIPSAVARRRDLLLKDVETLQRRRDRALPSEESSACRKASLLSSLSSARVPDSHPKAGEGPWRCVSCGKICLYSYYVLRPAGTAGISLGVLDNCVWCLRCFSDGRYPSALTERHFLKVGLPLLGGEGKDGKWTLEETERLIEGIEKYLHDWNEVAAHVGGGRTAQMCVERFIQLPIQEPLASCGSGERDAGPFRHFENPLSSLLAFMASTVHPSITAAAARAAVRKAVALAGDSEARAKESGSEDAAAAAEGDDSEAVAAGEEAKKAAALKPWAQREENRGLIADCELQVACATALAAGASEARQLAKLEEKEIGKLMADVVKLQLEKLELKMKRMQVLQTRIAQSKAAMETKFAQLLNEHRDLAAELVKTKEAALTALP